ncbi:hypothetical protein [Bacillus smithii]|uniref:hypothetical protein n=1 Tax=Bacillus smithii TaxID=1479 RepID=UPI000671AFC4|nr:hypothetical protein [Bacillus smithii]AKP47159.1 hypothetical protein BSM4216_1899 [Bacillus smithii]
MVPAEEAAEILNKVKTQSQKEKEIFQSIEEGTVDRSWMDIALKEKGCEIYDTSL